HVGSAAQPVGPPHRERVDASSIAVENGSGRRVEFVLSRLFDFRDVEVFGGRIDRRAQAAAMLTGGGKAARRRRSFDGGTGVMSNPEGVPGLPHRVETAFEVASCR